MTIANDDVCCLCSSLNCIIIGVIGSQWPFREFEMGDP